MGEFLMMIKKEYLFFNDQKGVFNDPKRRSF
jgi:hypothetical protein